MQIQLVQKIWFRSTSPTSLMHRRDYSALMDFSGNCHNHFAFLQLVSCRESEKRLLKNCRVMQIDQFRYLTVELSLHSRNSCAFKFPSFPKNYANFSPPRSTKSLSNCISSLQLCKVMFSTSSLTFKFACSALIYVQWTQQNVNKTLWWKIHFHHDRSTSARTHRKLTN